MYRRLLLCTALLVVLRSECLAGDPDTGYGTQIAVEFKLNDKPYKPPLIGHLEYTGHSFDIVIIYEAIGGLGVMTQAVVYVVVDKDIVSKGVHHIKTRNQNGVAASGTIDFRDQLKPRITLVTESGVVISNISDEGREWLRKWAPQILIGQ